MRDKNAATKTKKIKDIHKSKDIEAYEFEIKTKQSLS